MFQSDEKHKNFKLIFLLTIVLVLFLSVCTSYASTEYDNMFYEANQAHKDLNSKIMDVSSIDKYINTSSDANLLTDAEVASLLDLERGESNVTTKEDALSDIDLLFRVLKSTYPAYYYFGEKNYNDAQVSMESWVNSQSKINLNIFKNVIRNSLSFMTDSHAIMGLPTEELKDYKYKYYYANNECFNKDTKGFYQVIKNRKWYYVSSTNTFLSIQPTLNSAGELIYSPVIFSQKQNNEDVYITLQADSGAIRYKRISFAISYPYTETFSLDPNFTYVDTEELTYIAVRSFANDPTYKSQLDAFASCGTNARDSKMIILDIRGNSGGSDAFGRDFIKNLTGISPSFPTIGLTKGSKLSTCAGSSRLYPGTTGTININGTYIKNNIPIIVLVDDKCGSSGESMLNFAKCCENVVVIGSNSGGYQLSGNVYAIRLPKTGIMNTITSSFYFTYNPINVDGKGYTPDVWCNPKESLNAVLKMLLMQNIISNDTVNKVTHEIKKSENFITLKYGKYTVQSGSLFGGDHTTKVAVQYNGEKTSDYTFSCDNPNACSIRKNMDGTLSLTGINASDCKINITIGGKTGCFIYRPTLTTNSADSQVPRPHSNITLKFVSRTIKDRVFFANKGSLNNTFTVLYKGKKCTNYTFSNTNAKKLKLTKNHDSTLNLHVYKAGKTKITIKVGSTSAVFYFSSMYGL